MVRKIKSHVKSWIWKYFFLQCLAKFKDIKCKIENRSIKILAFQAKNKLFLQGCGTLDCTRNDAIGCEIGSPRRNEVPTSSVIKEGTKWTFSVMQKLLVHTVDNLAIFHLFISFSLLGDQYCSDFTSLCRIVLISPIWVISSNYHLKLLTLGKIWN